MHIHACIHTYIHTHWNLVLFLPGTPPASWLHALWVRVLGLQMNTRTWKPAQERHPKFVTRQVRDNNWRYRGPCKHWPYTVCVRVCVCVRVYFHTRKQGHTWEWKGRCRRQMRSKEEKHRVSISEPEVKIWMMRANILQYFYMPCFRNLVPFAVWKFWDQVLFYENTYTRVHTTWSLCRF